MIALLLTALPARAADPISGPFDVELPLTAVIADHRITGLAGAYTSVAEGSGSSDFNPASFGIRYPYSLDELDWDFHLDWLILNLGSGVDIENNGKNAVPFDKTGVVRFGFNVQYGETGGGLSAKVYEYTIAQELGSLQVKSSEVVFGVGTSFLKSQLALGVNLLGVALETRYLPVEGASDSVKYEGVTGTFGFVVRPNNQPWRVGMTLSIPLRFRQKNDDKETLAGLRLPTSVMKPLRLTLGFSWYRPFGDSKYNNGWSERQRTKPKTKDRRYLLVSSDVIIDAPGTTSATGLEGFVAQELERAGAQPTVGLRVGVESEVVHNRLKVRGGTYLEPSRFGASNYRVHGTVGAEVRLFKLWGWDLRLAATFDGAVRYKNLLVGVGFWH